MIGRPKSDQGQLFYDFVLAKQFLKIILYGKRDAAFDLSWLRSELSPH
jgi:hypothetical protein